MKAIELKYFDVFDLCFQSKEFFRREFEKSILLSGGNELNVDLPLGQLYIYITSALPMLFESRIS
jgi:hypothetical protein